MTTSEDLKAEFKKWLMELNDSCVFAPSIQGTFMKGAELGEAIGYQKGRAYERKTILCAIEKLTHSWKGSKSEVAWFFKAIEEKLSEPHEG